MAPPPFDETAFARAAEVLLSKSPAARRCVDSVRFAATRPIDSALAAGWTKAVELGGADPATMNPSVVGGLQDIAEASYLIQWLDTVNHPKVATAWLNGSQALLGGTMTAEEVMEGVRAAAEDAK